MDYFIDIFILMYMMVALISFYGIAYYAEGIQNNQDKLKLKISLISILIVFLFILLSYTKLLTGRDNYSIMMENIIYLIEGQER